MKLMFEEQLLSQPANPDSSLVQHYVRTSATCSLIGNVTTRMALLDTGTQQFPVSITEGNEPDDNCYVVSPQTAYSGYAREELKRLGRPWLTWPLKLLTRGVDCMLRTADGELTAAELLGHREFSLTRLYESA